jgi:uncharacterized protein YjbI with pentapeptide repeats
LTRRTCIHRTYDGEREAPEEDPFVRSNLARADLKLALLSEANLMEADLDQAKLSNGPGKGRSYASEPDRGGPRSGG